MAFGTVNRYKPVGWKGESHRHYLAAKGIATKYEYREKWMDKLHTNQSHSEVRRHASEERLKDLAESERSYKANKVCLGCGQEYSVPLIHLRQPRCPSCGFVGSIDSPSQGTGFSSSELPKAKFARKDYPNLYVTDEVPEIPVQGKTYDEYEQELLEKAARSEIEEEQLQKELTSLRLKHPILAIKANEEVKAQEELERLQKEYDDLRSAHHEYDSPKTIHQVALESAKQDEHAIAVAGREEKQEAYNIVAGGDEKDIEKVTEATPWMSKEQKHDEKLMLKLLSSYN